MSPDIKTMVHQMWKLGLTVESIAKIVGWTGTSTRQRIREWRRASNGAEFAPRQTANNPALVSL